MSKPLSSPWLRACLLAIPLASSAVPAYAHLVDVRFGDFYGGALHLIMGVQYALMLLALSILVGLQPKSQARWALVIVPLGVLIGAASALFLPGMSLALALIVCLLCVGALIASGYQTAFAFFSGLCGLCALILGYENGLAAIAAQDTGLALSGLTTAALLAICLMAAAALTLRAFGPWTKIAFRAIGSWIAAVSIIFLALNLTDRPSAVAEVPDAESAAR